MQEILKFAENRTISPTDTYQIVFLCSFITNQYFVWVVLVLLLNIGNWKRPVIIVLFFHWLFRSIGDILTSFKELIPRQFNKWPYSNKGWTYPYGVASLFWYLSEIIGDWYPLLRTKAIINNPQKIRVVYVICITFNIVKITQFYNFITYIPFKIVNGMPSDTTYFKDLGNHRIKQWGNVIVQLIISFLYDLAVIRILKTQIFNKIKRDIMRKNRFIANFKFISEYRIKISMISTIIAFPFLFCFSFLCISQTFSRKNNTISSLSAESIRQCVLNINYSLMYIDQILLRFFVERNKNNKEKYKNSSPLNYSNHYKLKYYPNSSSFSSQHEQTYASKHKYLELDYININ
ncbi:hypothetical protein H8356DRAFT_1332778 [Neocallimastix lanati (nom. inval.)]|uniref:G-protein coupled receptors family 1 profile domain-containing protein n=1 Tax=Neocallimastix californiae TaxID=1754190 RepID=A0A1Y2F4N0_9FUNG|nr:hypothetical protein H8356DRAFT_1332778 [Neocallimastix sp. JGI-2020a]ORY78821.1 hypothetical protein LY90DRAFT_501019 [Neocallimastix californiae]|eukprot:ORY78821.1 hypothetical protein LY90DRAFT_501019 [Neocallimastix californiae]